MALFFCYKKSFFLILLGSRGAKSIRRKVCFDARMRNQQDSEVNWDGDFAKPQDRKGGKRSKKKNRKIGFSRWTLYLIVFVFGSSRVDQFSVRFRYRRNVCKPSCLVVLSILTIKMSKKYNKTSTPHDNDQVQTFLIEIELTTLRVPKNVFLREAK